MRYALSIVSILLPSPRFLLMSLSCSGSKQRLFFCGGGAERNVSKAQLSARSIPVVIAAHYNPVVPPPPFSQQGSRPQLKNSKRLQRCITFGYLLALF